MKNVARKPVWLITPVWTCQCQQLEARDAWMRPNGCFRRSFGRVIHWNIHINCYDTTIQYQVSAYYVKHTDYFR